MKDARMNNYSNKTRASNANEIYYVRYVDNGREYEYNQCATGENAANLPNLIYHVCNFSRTNEGTFTIYGHDDIIIAIIENGRYTFNFDEFEQGRIAGASIGDICTTEPKYWTTFGRCYWQDAGTIRKAEQTTSEALRKAEAEARAKSEYDAGMRFLLRMAENEGWIENATIEDMNAGRDKWVSVGMNENYRYDQYKNLSFGEKIQYAYEGLQDDISRWQWPKMDNPYMPTPILEVCDSNPVYSADMPVKELLQWLEENGLAKKLSAKELKDAHSAYNRWYQPNWEALDEYRAGMLYQDMKGKGGQEGFEGLIKIGTKTGLVRVTLYDGILELQFDQSTFTYFI